MKLFILFLFICFVGGWALQRLSLRTMFIMLGGLCMLISVGYFFFNQI